MQINRKDRKHGQKRSQIASCKKQIHFRGTKIHEPALQALCDYQSGERKILHCQMGAQGKAAEGNKSTHAKIRICV